ncbi:MAG TPA: hypothetical protein VF189_03985 [Patescibacteria group bacterium]
MEIPGKKEIYPYQNYYRIFLTLASPYYVRESLFYLSQQTNKSFTMDEYLNVVLNNASSNIVTLSSASNYLRHHLQKTGILDAHINSQITFKYKGEFSLSPQVEIFLTRNYGEMKEKFPEFDFSFMEFTNKTTSKEIHPSSTALKFLQIAELVSKNFPINSKKKTQSISLSSNQIFSHQPDKKEKIVMNILSNKGYFEIERGRRGIRWPHERYKLTEKALQTIQVMRIISGR